MMVLLCSPHSCHHFAFPQPECKAGIPDPSTWLRAGNHSSNLRSLHCVPSGKSSPHLWASFSSSVKSQGFTLPAWKFSIFQHLKLWGNYMQDWGDLANGIPKRKAELDPLLLLSFSFFVTGPLKKLELLVLSSNTGQNTNILFIHGARVALRTSGQRIWDGPKHSSWLGFCASFSALRPTVPLQKWRVQAGATRPFGHRCHSLVQTLWPPVVSSRIIRMCLDGLSVWMLPQVEERQGKHNGQSARAPSSMME